MHILQHVLQCSLIFTSYGSTLLFLLLLLLERNFRQKICSSNVHCRVLVQSTQWCRLQHCMVEQESKQISNKSLKTYWTQQSNRSKLIKPSLIVPCSMTMAELLLQALWSLKPLLFFLKFFFFFFFHVSAPSLHLKQMELRFYVCKSHPPSHWVCFSSIWSASDALPQSEPRQRSTQVCANRRRRWPPSLGRAEEAVSSSAASRLHY